MAACTISTSASSMPPLPSAHVAAISQRLVRRATIDRDSAVQPLADRPLAMWSQLASARDAAPSLHRSFACPLGLLVVGSDQIEMRPEALIAGEDKRPVFHVMVRVGHGELDMFDERGRRRS
jgi:hypothetical protein